MKKYTAAQLRKAQEEVRHKGFEPMLYPLSTPPVGTNSAINGTGADRNVLR